MSKLFKSITPLFIMVALFVSGIFAPALGNTNDFGPPEGTGSITVTRVAGDSYPVVSPGHTVAGVPIRAQRVTFANGVIPTTDDLEDSAWMTVNATFVGSAVYGITGANGAVTFPNLEQGIWLVQELASLTVTADTINRGSLAVGEVVNNPIDSVEHFADFVVGIPRWIPELEWDYDEEEYIEVGGDWEFDVRVYPKSQLPEYRTPYKNAVSYSGSIATWELGQRIPGLVASTPYFSVTDVLPPTLSFIEGSVEGRFTIPGDASNGWNVVTGRLTPDTHFTVSNPGQQVIIEITAAGRLHLAEYGLLSDGHIMFRLDTAINGSGEISNDAVWRVGIPPDEPGGDPVVTPPTIRTFNLEVLKLNVAEQSLAGAVFNMYRTLTGEEAVLTGADFVALGATEITVDGSSFYVVPLTRLDGVNRVQITGTTGTDGITNFNGANMSSYGGADLWLREVTAPNGYRIIQEWMPITVNMATQRVVEDVNTYTVHATVYNEPIDGWNLPQTGGIGTIILTIAGLVLVGGALVLFVSGKEDEDIA